MNDDVEGLLAEMEAYGAGSSPAASTIRALVAEIERLREDLATRTMNWAKNNVTDKGEILRAEIKAATADAKLREAVEKAEYWEAQAEEWRECMKDAVEIGNAKLRDAVEVMRAVLPAVRKAGFVSSAQVLEAFLTDMEEP